MNNFSVVIPVYNSSSTIARCLDSVISQKIKPDEVIIVDDGSDDNTEKIINDYIDAKSSETKFYYFKFENNSGPATARNYGIKKSHYPWILFLDADDEWASDRIEKLEDFLNINSNANFIFSKYEYSNSKVSPSYFISLIIKVNKGVVPRWLMFVKSFIATPTVAINKEYVDELFDEKIKHCEDLDLWIRISQNIHIYCHDIVLTRPVANRTTYNGLSSNLQEMKKMTITVLSSNARNFFEKIIVICKKIVFH